MAVSLFWLIRPVFFDQTQWIGSAISDLEDEVRWVSDEYVDHQDLDNRVGDLEAEIRELEGA